MIRYFFNNLLPLLYGDIFTILKDLNRVLYHKQAVLIQLLFSILLCTLDDRTWLFLGWSLSVLLSRHVIVGERINHFESLAVLREFCLDLEQVCLGAAFLWETRLFTSGVHYHLDVKPWVAAFLVLVDFKLLQQLGLLWLIVGRVLLRLWLDIGDELLPVSTVQRLTIHTHELVPSPSGRHLRVVEWRWGFRRVRNLQGLRTHRGLLNEI